MLFRSALAAIATQVVGVPAQVARARVLLEGGLVVPTLSVIGSRDGAMADHVAVAALAVRLGATVTSVPGGHLFPMTHPTTTATAITAR